MLFRKRTRTGIEPERGPVPLEIPGLLGGGRTVIGRRTRVVGRLSGEGPVVVHGDVKGTIAIRGGLIVRGGGRIEADVQAHSVDLAGEAHGRMSASTRVSLSATGAFEGEMDTPILDVTPGSTVRGRARVAGLSPKNRPSSH
jgi:cytoskeletal protein CcmA (bactofilin family)